MYRQIIVRQFHRISAFAPGVEKVLRFDVPVQDLKSLEGGPGLCHGRDNGFQIPQAAPDLFIGKALLALVAILTHEIRHPLNRKAIYAFGPVASRQYAEAIAQDPDTLLMHVKLVERERMKRFMRLVADGEER